MKRHCDVHPTPRVYNRIQGTAWSEVLQVVGFICFWILVLIGSAQ